MPNEERPVIAVTIGDPAGIGPEVVLKALSDPEIYQICRPLVIGESATLLVTLKLINKPLVLHPVEKASETAGVRGTIDFLDLHNLDWKKVKIGKVSAECGKASMEFIDKALDLTLKQEAAALVTAPINKEATLLAGYPGLGHLEYIAKATGTKNYATMLVSGNLRCVHLTTHYSLRDACSYVKRDRILGRLKLTDEAFRQWGFKSPRIGVAGLNPHAGEGGMFGREELDEIAPAVEEAVRSGINASGPFPADTIFNRALKGEFEAVLVMYHDQGHIAIKVHGFEKSLSIALGLPVIRTSVDHGTAFEIAGKGIANAESMVEAIKTAVFLCERRYFG
jgi:4-phospho-D-threonate 3-dehydrogenase / 4-phospho-D-erythronate 3-dehydrogenase